MTVLKFYTLSSPQINNGPFYLDCVDRKGRKRTRCTSKKERKKERKKEKEGKEEKATTLYIRWLLSALVEWKKEREKRSKWKMEK